MYLLCVFFQLLNIIKYDLILIKLKLSIKKYIFLKMLSKMMIMTDLCKRK